MTVRTAADALADAVGAMVETYGAPAAVESALAAYRAATAKTKPAPVVHLSTELSRFPKSHATACYGGWFWARPDIVTTDPAAVTCKACRRTRAFKAATR